MQKITIHRATYKVSDLVSWYKQSNLNLNPIFQRRSVWNNSARSFLIDTIIKGFPIPVIIIRELGMELDSLESKREVVDGQQRLSTIISYVLNEILPSEHLLKFNFKLKAIHNETYPNKKFNQLPEEIRKRILNYELFSHVLGSETSDRQVLEIFSRMNSTGTRLNAQELRNAEYHGEFKTLAYDLSYETIDFFRNKKIFSETNISRMDEVELTNDFIIYILEGLQKRSPSTINEIYKKYDEEGSILYKDELKKRYQWVISNLDILLGEQLINSRLTKSHFIFALFSIYYDMLYSEDLSSKVKRNKQINHKVVEENLLRKFVERSQKDKLDELSKSTNGLKKRREIRKFISQGIS